MRKLIKCSTPDCESNILLKDFVVRDFVFCPKCKDEHSLRVLKTQAEHEKTIKEVILDSRMFKSANGMADYVGVSFVTMYNWIQKYFGMTFQEFRRMYICKSTRCYLLNIGRSSYSRNDYILKKIRSKSNYCACINSLEPNHIMTDCPVEVISGILRGCPTIKKISDKLFSLAPTPYHFGICKIYHFEICTSYQIYKETKAFHIGDIRPFHFSS